MTESQYEMIIYWDKTDNIYVVDVLELPGCMVHGKSKKSTWKCRKSNRALVKNSERIWYSDTRTQGSFNVCITLLA